MIEINGFSAYVPPLYAYARVLIYYIIGAEGRIEGEGLRFYIGL